MKLILFGAPGSGKGTQADMLAAEFGLRKISLGDILRDEVKKKSGLGLRVKECMDRGDLVSDEIVKEVVSSNLGKDDFILDGYPRNINQAKTLADILNQKNICLNAFIYLDVSQETIIDRLSKRRVCFHCKANYHLESMPPQKDGFCDICGRGLIQRDDDKPEVVKKRWNLFEKKSREIFSFYKDQGVFVSVDGNKELEAVFQEIKEKINES